MSLKAPCSKCLAVHLGPEYLCVLLVNWNKDFQLATGENQLKRDNFMQVLPMVSHPAKDRAPALSPQVTCLACTNGAMKCVSSDSLESYSPALCTLVYASRRHLSIVDVRRVHIDFDSMLRKVECPQF